MQEGPPVGGPSITQESLSPVGVTAVIAVIAADIDLLPCPPIGRPHSLRLVTRIVIISGISSIGTYSANGERPPIAIAPTVSPPIIVVVPGVSVAVVPGVSVAVVPGVSAAVVAGVSVAAVSGVAAPRYSWRHSISAGPDTWT